MFLFAFSPGLYVKTLFYSVAVLSQCRNEIYFCVQRLQKHLNLEIILLISAAEFCSLYSLLFANQKALDKFFWFGPRPVQFEYPFSNHLPKNVQNIQLQNAKKA